MKDMLEEIRRIKNKREKTLNLSGLDLVLIPTEVFELDFIEELDLSNNSIKDLPSELFKLPHLKKISLENNPIETPPKEIIEQGLEVIRHYFQELEVIGIDYLYEAKVLILGEGGAGKTTLARRILDSNAPMPEYEKSTQGIDITNFYFQTSEGREFKINLWDFGGQEIYTATHQFFLTRRSLYILLVDSRQENTNLNYWLNNIELYGYESPILYSTR